MGRTFVCPICAKPAELIRHDGEEVLLRNSQDINTTRKAPVQRLPLVECPVHGRTYALHFGHHITAGRGKRQRRSPNPGTVQSDRTPGLGTRVRGLLDDAKLPAGDADSPSGGAPTMTPRQQIVLAALAPAQGAAHSPVQLQKLLFLIDREVPTLVGGPHFNFRPYNYGPFDKAVYQELEVLAEAGLTETVPQGRWSGFRLTPNGQALGDAYLSKLPAAARDYIGRVSTFVRQHSFAALVSAIYKAYPEMRANSVFSVLS
jgi:hypothetical protein